VLRTLLSQEFQLIEKSVLRTPPLRLAPKWFTPLRLVPLLHPHHATHEGHSLNTESQCDQRANRTVDCRIYGVCCSHPNGSHPCGSYPCGSCPCCAHTMRPMRAIVRTPNRSATNEQTERLIVAFMEFAARTQMVHTLAARTLVARTLCCAHTMQPMRAIV